jgi:hypothetical protein
MDPAAAMAMMQNMTPEQLEQAAAAASSSGMLPAGMSPEMLKVRCLFYTHCYVQGGALNGCMPCSRSSCLVCTMRRTGWSPVCCCAS